MSYWGFGDLNGEKGVRDRGEESVRGRLVLRF